MRIPVRSQKRGLRFNITPLIDVVFLLIIFFLVASHFVRNEKLEAVELPAATQSEADREDSPRRLVVTITSNERLVVAGREVDLPELEQMILAGRERGQGRFEVRIRGDRAVPYRLIESILLACAKAGVTDVKFAVVEAE